MDQINSFIPPPSKAVILIFLYGGEGNKRDPMGWDGMGIPYSGKGNDEVSIVKRVGLDGRDGEG